MSQKTNIIIKGDGLKFDISNENELKLWNKTLGNSPSLSAIPLFYLRSQNATLRITREDDVLVTMKAKDGGLGETTLFNFCDPGESKIVARYECR